MPPEPGAMLAPGDQSQFEGENDAPPTGADEPGGGLACPTPTPDPPKKVPATMIAASMRTPAPRSRAGELRNTRINGSYEPRSELAGAECPCGPMIPYGAQIRGPQRRPASELALDGAAECAAAKEHALED